MVKSKEKEIKQIVLFLIYALLASFSHQEQIRL